MKNIGASVSAVLTREKKPVAAVAEGGIEEEECHQCGMRWYSTSKKHPNIKYRPWRSGVKTPVGI